MWEVAVLELQKDLQSTFLVEFFQSLNRSIVQVTVWHQTWRDGDDTQQSKVQYDSYAVGESRI